MRELDIILNLIQGHFDSVAPSEFIIKPETSVIAETPEDVESLNKSAFAAIQRQTVERKIEGVLKTSASRYAFGENVSFDWTISFNINNALRNEIVADIEEVRKLLKATEQQPIESNNKTVSFAVNMTSVFNISAQSGGITYAQCLMSGSCTIVSDAVLGQSIKVELKLPDSEIYDTAINVLSFVPNTEIKIQDVSQSGSVLRDTTPITADGLTGFIVQFNKDDFLHEELLKYSLDHTLLFDAQRKPKSFSYKVSMGETVLVEWLKATILKVTATINNGAYITLQVDIARNK